MYRCCIFDLDGTLVNSIWALTKSVNDTMEQFGIAPIDSELCKRFVGEGYKKLVERALIHGGDTKLVHYEEALTVYQKVFKECCMYRVEPYEGIRELLEELKKRGIRIAVLSNKPHARALDNVEGIFGKGYFDRISGQKEEIPRKPDPAGAFLTAEGLGVQPGECLYIGDTATDMETGKAAGMDTAAVLWGFRSEEELRACHPKYVVRHPGELLNLVEASGADRPRE